MRFFVHQGRALLLLSAAVTVGAVWMFGCAKKEIPITYDTLADDRDGQTYKTVKMPDGKIWMAENLNYRTDSSWCYENSQDSCAKYGRLYNWEAAKTACPSGWKLPDTADWSQLMSAVGGKEAAGNRLKSKSGWILRNKSDSALGTGTDNYGFSALSGGRYYEGMSFESGECGLWWTAVERSDSTAHYMEIVYGIPIMINSSHGGRKSGFSVRCVKDDTLPAVRDTFPEAPTGTVTDSRDGKTYKTVKIGKRVWMAENLNYRTDSSWCYGEGGQVSERDDNHKQVFMTLSSAEIQANCDKYGRLYDWKTAKTVCPAGFHLPSRREWDALAKAAGGETAGKALKSTSGWDDNGNGTNRYGFTAMPGGGRDYKGDFSDAGGSGYWWPAANGNSAYGRNMSSSRDYVYEFDSDMSYAFSVRCVE